MIENSKQGQFELTPKCTLNCKMCYIHDINEAGRTTLPASFWIDQAKQAVEEGMLVLSLTGGETLLYPELDELMDELVKLGLLISFNTNGTLVDEDRVEWFLKYCPNKINISLYGASDETYARFGMKDGFTKVSKAIDLLMQAGLNVYLNGMITPDNIQDIPAMHKFARERGLILHLSSYAYPLRTKPGMHIRDKHRLSPEDAAKAFYGNECLVEGRRNTILKGMNSLKMIELRKQGVITTPCNECNGGVQNFQISYDGKLRTCALLSGLSISLEDKSLHKGLSLLKKQMQEIKFPDQCVNCCRKDICPVCKAAIYLETGDYNEAPEYLCRYTQALEDILRKECRDVPVTLQHSGNLNHHNCTD